MTWQLATGYIFFLILALWFAFAVANYALHRRFYFHQRYELLLIRVPLGSEVHPFATEHRLSELGATTELLERLWAYRAPFSFEAVVHQVGEEIHFYIHIQKRLKTSVIEDVRRSFPDAHIESGDYDIWSFDSHVEIATIRQAKPSLVPLRSISTPSIDVFARVLRVLAQMKVVGEGAAIQLAMRPLSAKRRHEYATTIADLKSGKATSFKVLDEGFLITPQTVSVLDEKLDSPLFSVNGRVVIAHASSQEAKRIVREIDEALRMVSGGMLYNELYVAPPRNRARALGLFSRRGIDLKEEIVLSAQEITSFFHFPTRHLGHPKTHRLKANR